MRLLVVDDHPLILSAAAHLLSELEDGADVMVAQTADVALDLLEQWPRTDLILLDLQLGTVDGLQVLDRLRAGHPDVPVLVVSASDDPADLHRSLSGGARGFVSKRATSEALLDAARRVLRGEVVLPPLGSGPGELAVGAARPRTAPLRLPAPSPGPIQPPSPASLARLGLTPRQAEVLALVLQGLSNKAIARELSLSVETIKDHVAAVLRCLDVTSRTQAVLVVSQLLQASPPSRRTPRG